MTGALPDHRAEAPVRDQGLTPDDESVLGANAAGAFQPCHRRSDTPRSTNMGFRAAAMAAAGR